MTKEKLTDYTFSFWNDYLTSLKEEKKEEIKSEIKNNLSSLDGIEKELDYVRDIFDFGDCDDREEVEKLWNYLNWYKTNFKEMKENGL